jgi:hypothetical protein
MYGSGAGVLSGRDDETKTVEAEDEGVAVATEDELLVVIIDEGLAAEYPMAPGRDVLMHEHAEDN